MTERFSFLLFNGKIYLPAGHIKRFNNLYHPSKLLRFLYIRRF